MTSWRDKISPPPWKWEARKEYILPVLKDANDGAICGFGEAQSMDGWGFAPSAEDGAVMAAAPALLDAARLALRCLGVNRDELRFGEDRPDDVIDKLKKAITLATTPVKELT